MGRAALVAVAAGTAALWTPWHTDAQHTRDAREMSCPGADPCEVVDESSVLQLQSGNPSVNMHKARPLTGLGRKAWDHPDMEFQCQGVKGALGLIEEGGDEDDEPAPATGTSPRATTQRLVQAAGSSTSGAPVGGTAGSSVAAKSTSGAAAGGSPGYTQAAASTTAQGAAGSSSAGPSHVGGGASGDGEDAEEGDFTDNVAEKALSDPRKHLKRFEVPSAGRYLTEVQWLGATMPYYGSADLERDVPSAAQMAVVIMHGARRDGINYFCSLKRIVERQLAVPPERTLIVAPQFFYGRDEPGPTDVFWNGSKPTGDWRSGGDSDPNSSQVISSYDALDYLVSMLDNSENYPSLRYIIVMGHSAGGQTVHKYSLATNVETRHAKLRFVIANPSSYVYLDDNRWSYMCDTSGCTEGQYLQYDPSLARNNWAPVSGGYTNLSSPFGKPFICSDSDFGRWSYGMTLRDHVVTSQVPYIQIRSNVDRRKATFQNRDVIYLVGENDTCTDTVMPFCDGSCWQRHSTSRPCKRTAMDMRCAAMLQGWNRRVRARNYMEHLRRFFGNGVHVLVEVPGVGHQAEAMFLAPDVQRAVFLEG